MVAPNQPRDFKNKVRALLSRYAPIKGETRGYIRFNLDSNVELYFNIWATISYGYVGMVVGFDEKGLQFSAEVNAVVGPRGTNTGGNRVGRQIGFDLYKHYKSGQLTPDDIDKEIKAALPQLKKFPECQPFPGLSTAPTWPGRRLSGPWDMP